MVTNDSSGVYKAKVEALERGLQSKKEMEDKNLDLDIAVLRVLREVNLQFASWLVENVERQQKSPRELLNEVLILALQARQ